MKYLVIHHSATGTNVSDEIIKSWGFYNKVIKADGTTITQHDYWHERGNGHQSKDVCLIGNFMNDEPTEAQLVSLRKVIIELGLDIIGHRDIASKGFTIGTLQTLCPGDKLYKLLPTFNMKNVLVKYTGKNDIVELVETTKAWLDSYGIVLNFTMDTATPWAIADIWDSAIASGGCKKATPYELTIKLGNTLGGTHGKSWMDIFIHEILHCLYFDAGFGDMHDIKTEERPSGLGGSHENEYNINYYFKLLSGDMKVTKEDLIKLYKAIFHRDIDDSGYGYEGKDLSFILAEFIKSKEWTAYDVLHKAAKAIEELN